MSIALRITRYTVCAIPPGSCGRFNTKLNCAADVLEDAWTIRVQQRRRNSDQISGLVLDFSRLIAFPEHRDYISLPQVQFDKTDSPYSPASAGEESVKRVKPRLWL